MLLAAEEESATLLYPPASLPPKRPISAKAKSRAPCCKHGKPVINLYCAYGKIPGGPAKSFPGTPR